jgi:hypothetical protein
LARAYKETLNFVHVTKIVDVIQDMRDYAIDTSIQTSSPTITDIRKAINDLMPGKAAGIDQIPPEVLKADVNLFVNILFPIFKQAWELEKLPDDLLQSVLIKLLK